MRQKIFSLFVLLAAIVGVMPSMAQVTSPYLVDFETPIETNTSRFGQPGDANRDFKVASGWSHVVEGAYYNYSKQQFTPYTYHANKNGVDGSSCLQAGQQFGYDSYGDEYYDWHDILVTPLVSGTVTIDLKKSTSNGQVNFYIMTKNGETFERGRVLKSVTSSQLSSDEYTTITIGDLAESAYVGIHAQNVYMDNFTATSADLSLKPGLKVVSIEPNTAQSLAADENGNFTVTFDATVKNTGEIDLTAGTENYSLTLKKFSATDDHVTLVTVPIAEDLAVGATTTSPVTLTATLNTADYPAAATNGISFRVYENISNTFISSKNVTVVPYVPGIQVVVGKNKYESGAELYFGYSHDAINQEFVISNTGGAPLQITGVTLPDGYETDLAACTIQAQQSDTFHITLPNTQLGEKTGAMVIQSNAGDMTLNLRATIVGGDVYFVDFETDEAVDGMLVEQTGSGYSAYGWQTRKSNTLGYPNNSFYASSSLPYSNPQPFKLITPLLEVQEGDVLSFEAGKGYSDALMAVYYSADRKTWTKVRSLSSTAENEADQFSNETAPNYGKALKQFKIANIPAGQWYVAFEHYANGDVKGDVVIDNIYGYKRVNVERDVVLTASSIANAAQVNYEMKASATVRNLKQEPIAANDYTARLYFGDMVQKELTATVLNGPAFGSYGMTTDNDVTFDFSTTPHAAGSFQAYIQFEFTNGTKLTSDTVEVTVEGEVYSALKQVGEMTTTQSGNPVDYYYNKEKAVNVYSESELRDAGIMPGKKISKVAFKGYNTSKAVTAPTTLWLASLENEELINTGSSYSMKFPEADSIEALTPVFSGSVTLQKAGTSTEPENIFTIDLPTPYIYNGGNLAVMTFFDATTYIGSGLNWCSGTTNAKLLSIAKKADSNFGSYDSYSKTTYRPVVLLGVEAEPNTVSGTVTSAETGAALAGAVVKATCDDVLYSGTTDAEGNYSFAIMQDAKDYTLTTVAEGYFPQTETVSVKEGSQTRNAALQQAKGLFIEESSVPTTGMQNIVLTATAKATNYTTADFAAGSYTAHLYWGNEVVAEAEAVALKKGETRDYTFTFTPHKADSLGAYIAFTQADNIASTDTTGLVVEEETLPGGELVIGDMSANDRNHFYIDGYNNDGKSTIFSDIVYTADQLKAFGLKPGSKVTHITFKGTASSKSMKLDVVSWVGLSTGDITPGQPDKTTMTEVRVYDPDADDLIETKNLTSVIDLSASPLRWDGTSNIRVYTEQQPTGPYNTIKYDYDDNYKTSYYNATTAQGTILGYFTTAADALSVSGTVTDGELAIANAAVTLTSNDGDDVQYASTTDAEGQYSVSVIQASRTYVATVSAAGYKEAAETVQFGEENLTKNFVLVNNKVDLEAEIATAQALLDDASKTEGRDELTTAIAAAQALVDASTLMSPEEVAEAIATLKAAEKAFAQANMLASGRYYVRNVTTNKFWGAGNNWGTRASLVDEYQYVTLAQLPDGTYTMESMVCNNIDKGNTDKYFNGDYMDNGSPVHLTIAKKGNYYTIANGTAYYGYDGTSTVLGKDLAADSDDALWQLLTDADIAAEKDSLLTVAVKTATMDNPVNVTLLLINDANFGRNRLDAYDAWTMEAGNKNLRGGGDNGNGCAESWHSNFTMTQAIANVPKGVYKFTAQGFYRQDGSDNEHLPFFYVNDETAQFPAHTGSENSMTDAGASFLNGLYTIDPLYIEVKTEGEETTGNITVGTKLEGNTNLWCIWDNFQLIYYGPDADLNALKNAAAIDQLAQLRQKAAELKDSAALEVAVVKSGLEQALESTTSVEPTADALATAINTLTDAIDKGEAAIIARNVLPQMKAFTESTNFYTAETLKAYYTDFAEKYEAGTLTKAEAQSLQNPNVGTGWRAENTVDDLLMSVWDENVMNWDSYHVNTWSNEGDNDGTNFRVPFIEYWTGDDNSLAERNITATITGVEPGDYDVTGWVRVRTKNNAGATTEATGISLQVNDGEPVSVTTGDTIVALNQNNNFVLGHYTATGKATEDGTLTVTFTIAADNNISWLAFKDMVYTKNTADIDAAKADLAAAIEAAKAASTAGKTAESQQALADAIAAAEAAANDDNATVESIAALIAALKGATDGLTDYVDNRPHTWNFTKWSDATVADLKAEAAKGTTEGLWSDIENTDPSKNKTAAISVDNCFWQVGTSDAAGETLTANGNEIAELKGLQFINNKTRSLAIAVNYADCTSANGAGFGPYQGPSYLWLGSKNVDYFVIKNVKAGTVIKMGVESHKLSDARGVKLFVDGAEQMDEDGNAVAAPTTYTELSWKVSGDEGTLVDVTVQNTNGCHLYFIDAEIGDPTTVGISTIKAAQAADAIFTLSGQKVQQTSKKGLYIVGGKKIIKK